MQWFHWHKFSLSHVNTTIITLPLVIPIVRLPVPSYKTNSIVTSLYYRQRQLLSPISLNMMTQNFTISLYLMPTGGRMPRHLFDYLWHSHEFLHVSKANTIFLLISNDEKLFIWHLHEWYLEKMGQQQSAERNLIASFFSFLTLLWVSM